MKAPQLNSREALNGMLQRLPVHVFCFDRELVCRFAAPIGPHFLGINSHELPGMPLEGVFPRELALRPQFEAVLRTRQPWYAERLRYPSGPQGAWESGIWCVHAQPYERTGWLAAGDEVTDMSDTLNEQQTESVVLVSCIEKPCIGDAAPETAAPNELQYNNSSDDQAAFNEAEPEGPHTAVLLERVRTKLTIVRGFSQLLRRRLRRQDPDGDIHELDRIGEAVSELDELLYRYERGALHSQLP